MEVNLSEQQREKLLDVRDRYEKPYMCERAAAVLKVAGPRCNAASGTNGKTWSATC
jgi:hypothetical protein